MAKRTSRKASSSKLKTDETTVKKIKAPEAQKEGVKKPRTRKANPLVSNEDKSAQETAVAKREKPVKKKATPAVVEKELIAAKKADKTVPKKAPASNAKKERGNRPLIRKAAPADAANKPALRSVYSNSKYTLLVLGFGSDFNTRKSMVIFSDLLTGQVHTIALSLWKRWKLKEVKKINTET